MPELLVETPEGVTLRYELAGAGSRSAAALLDLLCLLAAWLAFFVVFLIASSADPTGLSQFVIGLLIGGLLISLSLYPILFGIFWAGLTPGKWLVGLRVADAQGAPASAGQHVLRGLFWPLEAVLLVPLPLGVVLMAATPRSQRLGDLVAGTLVLRRRRRTSVAEPFARETWSRLPQHRLPLVPAHAARFDGRDLEFLRELLGRVGMTPPSRRDLLVSSARHYEGRLELELGAELGAEEAFALLRELYLFLRDMRVGYSSRG